MTCNQRMQALVIGQIISLLVAGTGVFTTRLELLHIEIPASQSLLNYTLLCGYLGWKFISQRNVKIQVILRLISMLQLLHIIQSAPFHYLSHSFSRVCLLYLKGPAWKYLVCALADVEANFLVVKAYQYTTITSIMLLDCFTIPCTMVLSKIFLGYRVHCFSLVVY